LVEVDLEREPVSHPGLVHGSAFGMEVPFAVPFDLNAQPALRRGELRAPVELLV
jgi:hypothetical protein